MDSSLELEYYKNDFYCIILDEDESEKYYFDEVYRKEMDNKLKPKLVKKLCLRLEWCENVTDVNSLGNIHTLEFYNCENIRDVSGLGKVHNL